MLKSTIQICVGSYEGMNIGSYWINIMFDGVTYWAVTLITFLGCNDMSFFAWVYNMLHDIFVGLSLRWGT